MSRTSNDGKGIQRITGVQADFLTKYATADQSLAGMASMVVLPRMKIIQGQTEHELKKKFGEGSVIIRPGDGLIWKADDAPFLFVPLFFHKEWIKWADNKDKERMIVEGPVYKEGHNLAIKSKDKNSRQELYEGHKDKPDREKCYYSYVEHLCWTGVIYGDHPLAGTEVVLSMERGEYYNGREWINAISMRRQTIAGAEGQPDQRVRVPLWAQVWAMQPNIRNGELGSWYGYDFQPADNAVIDASDAEAFSSRHAELTRLFNEGKLAVTHDDEGNNQGKPAVVDDDEN